VKAGHFLPAQLQLSYHIASYDCILRFGQYPYLAKYISFSARAGPGLGVFQRVEMPAAATPEDDEHQKLKGFTGSVAELR
jgi:hypothetical protein